MFVWFATAAGIIALGVALQRVFRRRTPAGRIDVTPVSTSWIVEHRADRRDQ